MADDPRWRLRPGPSAPEINVSSHGRHHAYITYKGISGRDGFDKSQAAQYDVTGRGRRCIGRIDLLVGGRRVGNY